jgi:ATP-dependent Lon protease
MVKRKLSYDITYPCKKICPDDYGNTSEKEQLVEQNEEKNNEHSDEEKKDEEECWEEEGEDEGEKQGDEEEEGWEEEKDEDVDEEYSISSDSSSSSEDSLDIFERKWSSEIKMMGGEEYENFMDVYVQNKKTEPDILQILKEPLKIEDKAELVNLFHIYKGYRDGTEEWLDMRKKINKQFNTYKAEYKSYSQYSSEEHEKMSKDSEIFSRYHSSISLKNKILNLNTTVKNKEVLYRKYEDLMNMKNTNSEYDKLKNFLIYAVDLPYDNIKTFPYSSDDINIFLKNVSNKLDQEIYGMHKAKEQILLFLNCKLLVPDMKKCHLGLIGPPGVGKCLALNTPVIMYDGDIKKVQDIKVGDIIMGDDSTPRNILSVCTGKEKMYIIKQSQGYSYKVNESHILSLKVAENCEFIVDNVMYNMGDVLDICVREYVKLDVDMKSKLEGFKVSVEFDPVDVPYDPYKMGLWIGTNNFNKIMIGNGNKQLLHHLIDIFDVNDINFINQNIHIDLSGDREIYSAFSELGLLSRKFIPKKYKINSRDIRLRLLAGIIDSNGHYNKNTKCFKFLSKNKFLVNDIEFLCRSLGFGVKKRNNNNVYTAYIYGEGIENIPVMNKDKKADASKENVLSNKILVCELDVDDYYGFTIDGNNRFLLGDFTVTHNTMIAKILAKIMDYPFEQISLGGVNSSEFLKGHDYTYVGSQPGEMVKCLKQMKYKNGILFFDEFEKIKDSELISSLLHITDPVQNSEFKDNYLGEITIDLSYLWFIYSMNALPKDDALSDRMFYIELEGYSHKDKAEIIKRYLFPKLLKNVDLNRTDISMSKEATKYFIEKICSKFDKGVRTIEKNIFDIINKIIFLYKNQSEDGTLDGFDVSFNIGRKIIFPFVIDIPILDKLLIFKEIDSRLNNMYI